MRLLVVEDEPRISDGIKAALDAAGLCVRRLRRRRGRLVPRRHGSLRSRRARPRPAEDGRPLRAQALARRGTQHAGAGVDRTRHMAGTRRGYRRRRRRLSRQAVSHRGAACPRACPHSPLCRPRQCVDRSRAASRSTRGRCGSSPAAARCRPRRSNTGCVAYLMHHKGRVVPPHELIEHLYGDDDARNANALEALIMRLRKKLGAEAIETRRGFGYLIAEAPHELRLAAPEAARRRGRLRRCCRGPVGGRSDTPVRAPCRALGGRRAGDAISTKS